ncbi:MAG: protein-tyrosine-phosphatase [Chloroflexota bacterium]|nr:protein-tyrosine-phosphatase [Chloroflexota bacterium]
MVEPGADPPPRIDWLPAHELGDGRPGRIGMTVLPGKRGASVRYPGRVYRGDLDADLASLTRAGVRRLVLLVDDEELSRWGDASLVSRAAAMGLEVDRHPITDGRPPESAARMDAILASIRGARASGDVAVACMGGVGRTGTVVACALVAAGWSPDTAIARVRELRHPTAVETPSQERFVQTYRFEPERPSAKVAP